MIPADEYVERPCPICGEICPVKALIKLRGGLGMFARNEIFGTLVRAVVTADRSMPETASEAEREKVIGDAVDKAWESLHGLMKGFNARGSL